ncbi:MULTISPECIES: iron-sulfur cluster repair di-iron protein, ric [unclassified Jeotgalibaca]|uniref:iron-sulfur cluster repair di-iron protein, ric n=1 Tax=unclassified Jeotgalibaca TaxID=2621505 RepID=UPI003FD1A8E0
MAKINEYINDNHEKLDLFTTAITRAHGKNHPEAFDVRELYSRLQEKVQDAGDEKPDLDTEFAQLREVTSDYAVPGDVCGTYEAVYNMLEEADKVYSD